MRSIYQAIGYLSIAIYLIISIATLDQYGINWDATSHLMRGQAYLNFFLTGRDKYELREGERKSFFQMPNYDLTVQKKVDGDHPVFSDITSSFFNYIFYQKLGVLGDFEAYHLYGPVLTSVFLVFMFLWVERLFGGFAAAISVLSLMLYPLFYGESHFNVQKDIPEALYYGFSMMAFYIAYTKRSEKWILFSAIFFGFALGTKFNIVFMPITVILWILIKENIRIFKTVRSLKKSFWYVLLIYPLIGFSIFYFSWPNLWDDPIKKISQVLDFYRGIGITSVAPVPASYYQFGINTYAIKWIFYTTPIATLILVGIGILYALIKGFKETDKASFFVLFWLVVPIARVSISGANIYGGVRQIMEFAPAMAILSGIGAIYIVSVLHGFIVTRLKRFKFSTMKQLNNRIMAALQLIIFISFIPITWRMINLFPHESIYFNSLIGGLKGAKERDIPGWGNSLGSTYREAKYWLNKHAEKNAKVALVHELVSNIPRTLLRSDIKYSNVYRSGPKRQGEYLVGLTHHGTFEDEYHRRYLERFLIPVYEIKVDDVPILKIWKNNKEHLKPEYKEEKELFNFTILKEEEEGRKRVVVEFSEPVILTKLELFYKEEDCIIPKEGRIRISRDNQFWQTLSGSFTSFPSFHWFKPDMEKGKLQYLFADEVKAVRFIRNTDNSCLWKHPLRLRAWGYQKH